MVAPLIVAHRSPFKPVPRLSSDRNPAESVRLIIEGIRTAIMVIWVAIVLLPGRIFSRRLCSPSRQKSEGMTDTVTLLAPARESPGYLWAALSESDVTRNSN
jgi:hypothetical protein